MGSVNNATEVNKSDRLPAEAKKILQSLASGWDDIIDPNAIKVIPLKGAMTNEVYQIKWPTNTERSRKVLVRIYGEGVEVFFDRDNEIRTFEFMSRKGQGPRLLGRFSNGRIEEFIHARVWCLYFYFYFYFLSNMSKFSKKWGIFPSCWKILVGFFSFVIWTK